MTIYIPSRVFGYIRNLISTLVLLALVHTSAVAQQDQDTSQELTPQERAQQALENGDVALALTIYQRRAYAGEAWAQVILAQINQNGRLVEPSIANAVDWYGRAAATGSAEAQYRLGLIFCDEQNENNNRPAKCIDWLQRAANNKHPGALYQLAMLAQQGRYINIDLAKMRALANQAMEAGVEDAKTLITKIDQDLKSVEQKVRILDADIIATRYNPDKVTVRLAAFKNKSQLEQFVLKSSLKPLFAYKTAGAWVLSHGSFSTQEKALSAMAKLDKSMHNLEPKTLSWSEVRTNLQKSAQES